MNTTNPLRDYMLMYELSPSACARELHTTPQLLNNWLRAKALPKSAAKLLSLVLAMKRGKVPNMLHQGAPTQRAGVYLACTMFDISWRGACDLLGRTPQHFKLRYETSKWCFDHGKAAPFSHTLTSHEMYYLHLWREVAKTGYKPKYPTVLPGGVWVKKVRGCWDDYYWVLKKDCDPATFDPADGQIADHTEMSKAFKLPA